MNYLNLIVTFMLLIVIGHCADNSKSRYDNYRLYRVHLNVDEQVKIFQDIENRSDSYIFIGHAREIGQKLSILLAAHKVSEFADILTRYNVTNELLVENFQEKIDAQEKTVIPPGGSTIDWKNYYHLETIYAWFDKLATDYKDIVQIIDAGKSYENVTIKGIKLSHKNNNTGVFIEGGIHAREWISPATATFLLNQLLTSTDADIKNIAENHDWYFFPVINPDGYKYTFSSDRMWRKTRQPNGICRGTDLNRNWEVHWNETGSSPDPCAYDYAGTKAFSEPEAAVISKFLEENARKGRIQTYLSLHSYSQLLMFPHGAIKDKAPNYDDLKVIGTKAVEALKKRYNTNFTTGSVYETIYPSAGSSHDWVYSTLNIPISFTFELRGPSNSTDMFILPAEQIEPVGYETLDAIVALLGEARQRGYYNESMIPWNPNSAFRNGNGIFTVLIIAIATCVSYRLQ